MMLPLFLSAVLAAGSSSKTMVRAQPGRTVTYPSISIPGIPDDSGTVSHLVFRGGTLVDLFGNVWTPQGTVPRVTRSGTTPEGAGPFSTTNRYDLGTGNDVLDFAGDWYAVVVYKPTATAVQVPFSDTNGSTVGYYIGANPGTGRVLTFFNGSGHGLDSIVTKPASGIINVICVGRAGTGVIATVNAGIAVSTTAGQTAATSVIARLGTDGTFAADGVLYEIMFSTGTATAAKCAAAAAAVKARYAITAW